MEFRSRSVLAQPVILTKTKYWEDTYLFSFCGFQVLKLAVIFGHCVSPLRVCSTNISKKPTSAKKSVLMPVSSKVQKKQFRLSIHMVVNPSLFYGVLIFPNSKFSLQLNSTFSINLCRINWFFVFSVEGSYCLAAPNPPFCPKFLNGFGNERCCSYAKMFEWIWIFSFLLLLFCSGPHFNKTEINQVLLK